RIKNYTFDYVTFEYKDYYANGAKTLYTLKTFDFIEKLIRHIPPHYFNVIRHYGIIASRVKSKYKKLTNNLLGIIKGINKSQSWQERQKQYRGEDPLICRICKRSMSFVKTYTQKKLSQVKKSFQRTFG
ncbi:transposase, partial [Candidatus Magnetomorum sp. HK-1]